MSFAGKLFSLQLLGKELPDKPAGDAGIMRRRDHRAGAERRESLDRASGRRTNSNCTLGNLFAPDDQRPESPDRGLSRDTRKASVLRHKGSLIRRQHANTGRNLSRLVPGCSDGNVAFHLRARFRIVDPSDINGGDDGARPDRVGRAMPRSVYSKRQRLCGDSQGLLSPIDDTADTLGLGMILRVRSQLSDNHPGASHASRITDWLRARRATHCED